MSEGTLPACDERLPLLDRLRGIAILGVLVANIPWYSQPISSGSSPRAPTDLWIDRVADMIVLVLVDGKMVTLLTVLFGAGLALQADKARAAGREFVPGYLRRQALLFAIGIAHGVLLWYGDILSAYAGVGCLATLFLALRPGRMLAVAAFLWAGTAAVLGGLGLLRRYVVEPMTGAVTASEVGEDEESADPGWDIKGDRAADTSRELETYRSGPWSGMVEHRAWRVAEFLAATVTVLGWQILAGFLTGMALHRLGWFSDPGAHRMRWRRVALWGIGLGIPVHLLAVPFAWEGRDIECDILQYLGVPFLTAGYLGLIALWTARGPGAFLARGVTAAGRLALSNYLAHSVVCGFIFYSYGLGWFGVFGRTENAIWVLLLWGLELPVSLWWVGRFRQGPVEWAWRSLAAGRALPFRSLNMR
ncbi:MAG: DUF418 domain-containing protein [Planctomycetes bacterium]|nr:DUF418 domain-containing protein [Planctomycetota bacterium]